MSIDVSIWSDIACPWCFIGKRRFEKALEQFPGRDDVAVTWRSYQLDPTLPEHDHRGEVDYLAEAKGLPRAQVEQMIGQVTEVARAEGLAYDFGSLVVANSRRAHRLLHFAGTLDTRDGGRRKADLKERLLAAHFEQGRNIGDASTLAALASEVGIARDDAEAAVESEELDRAVEADIEAAREIGVQGVPFFVFNAKYGVSGAQSPDVFLQVLERVASERAPKLIDVGGSGDACGPDGC